MTAVNLWRHPSSGGYRFGGGRKKQIQYNSVGETNEPSQKENGFPLAKQDDRLKCKGYLHLKYW